MNSDDYTSITGDEPPPSPIDARTYTEYGFPWFELYDERRGDIAAAEPLGRVRSTGEIDRADGGRQLEHDRPVDVPDDQVRRIRPHRRRP